MSRFINDESAIELADMAVSKGILSEDNFNKLNFLNQESGQSIVSIMFERAEWMSILLPDLLLIVMD